MARIRELADKRLSIAAIAKKLTEEGHDCRGETWDARRVGQILRRKRTQPPAGLAKR